jgi:hypothetical protein
MGSSESDRSQKRSCHSSAAINLTVLIGNTMVGGLSAESQRWENAQFHRIRRWATKSQQFLGFSARSASAISISNGSRNGSFYAKTYSNRFTLP